VAGDTIDRLPFVLVAAEAHAHSNPDEGTFGRALSVGDRTVALLTGELRDSYVPAVREVHVWWKMKELIESQWVAAGEQDRQARSFGRGPLTNLVTHHARLGARQSCMGARGLVLMAELAGDLQLLGVLAVIERHRLFYGGRSEQDWVRSCDQ
jgi:hypothetical protein